jgi:hypothetical protein
MPPATAISAHRAESFAGSQKAAWNYVSRQPISGSASAATNSNAPWRVQYGMVAYGVRQCTREIGDRAWGLGLPRANDDHDLCAVFTPLRARVTIIPACDHCPRFLNAGWEIRFRGESRIFSLAPYLPYDERRLAAVSMKGR